MTINAQNRLLPDWFARLRTRQLVLPRFQRFEAWSHSNVSQLLNTILRGLPAGAVFILEVGNEEPFISRAIEGAPKSGERVTEHLLDGQQRLTALWRALHNNYEERTYFIYLELEEETGMPYYVDSIGRWKQPKDEEPRPFWANDPAAQWKRRMIPLDLCAPGDEAQSRYREWSRTAIPDAEEREEVYELRSAIREQFATFNLPYLSLPVSTGKETALDVFIRMNTTAEPLSTYDIVVAQVEAALGTSLHDLVAETKETCPEISAYYSPEELVLQASALLQNKSPTNSTYMSKDFGVQLMEHWDQLIMGVQRATRFLEEERIFDSARLPTDVVVPVLSALWAIAPDGLDGEGRARTVLRKYIWRAFFSDRYANSTNSRSLQDFSELKPLVLQSDSRLPIIFDDERFPLPGEQELISAGWPKKKDRLPRAILACALKQGGHDLADGSTVARSNLPQREYHHIFPDAHLKRGNFDDQKIFRSLNCALVTWKTNRNMSDKDPERYLAERREHAAFGDAEIKARLETHLIPYEQMVNGDYEAFLTTRANMIYTRMLELCNGEH